MRKKLTASIFYFTLIICFYTKQMKCHCFLSKNFKDKAVLCKFKACVLYFLFHLKSSFHSQDIQIFVFSSSTLFLFVSHCFRGWSKINVKIYDIINCLKKNLITYFVLYLEKGKSYDIEILSTDWVLNKEHFYGNIMQKICTKS